MEIFFLQNTKYNSSKGGYSSSTTSDSRYEGRMRDSPNGNSYSPAGGLGMGMGADRDSPRNYPSKPLYKKERENRDYKLSSRDKYSGEISILVVIFIRRVLTTCTQIQDEYLEILSLFFPNLCANRCSLTNKRVANVLIVNHTSIKCYFTSCPLMLFYFLKLKFDSEVKKGRLRFQYKNSTVS